MKKLIVIIVGLCTAPNCFTQSAGSLDLSFSNDGYYNIHFNGLEIIFDLAQQSNGKIIANGFRRVTVDSDYSVSRLNLDGTLDSTFGVNGYAYYDFLSNFDASLTSAVQSDDKILIGGSGNFDFGILRYNPDGTLDNTFGTAGKVSINFGVSTDECRGIAIQPDGKIIVAGKTYSSASQMDFCLARLNVDGSLDTTFGTAGKVVTDMGGQYDWCMDAQLQSDGKIVLVGYSQTGTSYNSSVARYNTDGSLDMSFDSDGKLTFQITGVNSDANSVEIQPDGKILVGGRVLDPTSLYAVTRLNIDGSFDPSFGTSGHVVTPIGITYSNGSVIALQTDGKIVQTGWASHPNDTVNNSATVRYNSDGTLDGTFGSGGVVFIQRTSQSTDLGETVMIQTDGKILVGGTCGGSNWGMTRYLHYSTIGIENNHESNISIYPNPVKEYLNIDIEDINGQVQLELLTEHGEFLLQEKINSSNYLLNTCNIPSGIYILVITDDDRKVSFKIVKQ